RSSAGSQSAWLSRSLDRQPSPDDVMSERDQFVGQPRNDALGVSIKLGRNGLSQRSYLRDLHATILSGNPTALYTLHCEGLACCAGQRTATAPARPSHEPRQLSSARLTLVEARSVRCRF